MRMTRCRDELLVGNNGRMRELFESFDESADGQITEEEFIRFREQENQ